MKKMNKKVLIAALLIASTTISAFAGLTFLQAGEASPGPKVLIDPPQVDLYYCRVGDTALCVADFTDLYAVQFMIWWDKDELELEGYEWKPTPWHENMTFVDYFENATHKGVRFAIAAYGSSSPFTYPGTWAFVDAFLHCIKPNVNSTVTFDRDETRLMDYNGIEIPIEEYLGTVVINPAPPELYWKENYTDYAPSGVPDFSQYQDQWINGVPPIWSWCAPTSVANSLWWMDSRYESSTTPPPMINDTFPLVSNYTAGIDDHDPANVIPFIEHLGYLMDTDGNRTGIFHVGTNITDMQTGIAHYLSWTGVNPQGDVNGDGTVDQTDLNIVAAAFGTSSGNSSWNMAADIYPVTTGWPNVASADNKVNMFDVQLVAANINSTGMFYEKTVLFPEFYFIEEEVERCEDVILGMTFYYGDGYTENYSQAEGYGFGHAVTVAGVNSSTLQIAVSDPGRDNAEVGGLGRVLPPINHSHPATPPDPIHNNASFVSQDVYNVNLTLPAWSSANFSLIGYSNPYPPFGGLAIVDWAVIVSPIPPPPPPPPPPPEPLKKLIDIVEWPGTVHYTDAPFPFDASSYEEIEGYEEILTHLQFKGYTFDPANGTAIKASGSIEMGNVTDDIGYLWIEEFSGTVTSWWSNNTLEDGTRACMLSAEMDNGTTMAMAFVTNLLPPEQVPGVDPYIIVNAMPYMYVRFYWWSWHPIGKIVTWSYWWYDSHSHPNWFWGPYWWWRVYIWTYIPSTYTWVNYQWVHSWPFPWTYWRSWWGWWWHWMYWRHWHWWSTYFPYDP